MKPLNRKELKAANLKFVFVFSITLILLFSCSFFTLYTAQKGSGVLEEKHSGYNEVFANQAQITFKIEKITAYIHSLKNKNRAIYEHREFQSLILGIRIEAEKIIQGKQTESNEFALYSQLLDLIKAIQTTIDAFEQEAESFRRNDELLKKCRKKYQEEYKKKNLSMETEGKKYKTANHAKRNLA